MLNKKRIFSVVIALAVLLTSAGIATIQPASAASKGKAYVTLCSEGVGAPGKKSKEKVGSYYFWIEGDLTGIHKLKCAKSLKEKGKVLVTLKGDSLQTLYGAATDGNTAYYLVAGSNKNTIYKTTVKGTKPKKITTVPPAAYELSGVYNGNIYYTAISEKGDKPKLYSYNIAKKKKNLEKKNLHGIDGYGRYMILNNTVLNRGNCTTYLYDLKTKKTKKLKKATGAVVNGKTIYYLIYKGNSKTNKWLVQKSNLSGKKIKTIKTVKNMGDPSYFGKKAAYFQNYETGKTTKLTYKTKKLTTVK